jgi:hypothetical protein
VGRLAFCRDFDQPFSQTRLYPRYSKAYIPNLGFAFPPAIIDGILLGTEPAFAVPGINFSRITVQTEPPKNLARFLGGCFIFYGV